MRLKICVSDRCFFPGSAFKSSRTIVNLAKSLGYEQVEFHPTWTVWLETLVKGKLSCRASDISSFHISWREDGIHDGYSFFKRSFLVPAYWIFPPEPGGTNVLKKLARQYRKPVVVHWPEDFNKYKKCLLELHGSLSLNREAIEKLLKKGQIKGIVIDTDKFSDWILRHKEKESRVLRRVFPYIKEGHFRFRQQKDVQALLGKQESKTVKLMRKLINLGYKGRVVVEMGWPERELVEVIKQQGVEKTHQMIVKFLRSLYKRS